MFRFIIKLFCFSSLFADPVVDSSKEWASLGPVIKNTSYTTDREEEDPSIWVIFAKQMGDENFMIRFPENPVYTYPNPEELRVTAQLKGELYSATVLRVSNEDEVEVMIQRKVLGEEIAGVEVIKSAENVWDLVYRSDGKWVAIRYFLSPQHLYILQSENSLLHRENHQKFVDSLDVIFSKN